MQIDVQMLLDSFETPAVFYRENTVRYFNEWAKRLYPEIVSGKGLPEEFFSAASPFVPEPHEMQRGILYLLRPRRQVVSGDLAQVARELRARLSSLTLAVSRLSEHLSEAAPEEVRLLLQTSNQDLCRLQRLADHSDLLRQLEETPATVYREGRIDLAELCAGLAEQLTTLAARTGIRFCFEGPGKALPFRGDPVLFRRMLLNLISNAMRAAGAGGTVGLRLEKRGERAHIVVWDNGSGMDAEQLLNIFRPQPRRHRLPKPGEGAAMGLRLVREIVVLHQGLILAENRPGGGVTMTLSFPLKKGDPGLYSQPVWGVDPIQLILTELADVLPAGIYSPEELDG